MELPLDLANHAATYTLKNSGSKRILFSEDVRTTCGCMEAKLECTELAPGDSTQLVARINGSSVSGNKRVELVVPVMSPDVEELRLAIEVSYQGDWYIRQRELQFEGTLGSEAYVDFDVYGTPSTVKQLQVAVIGDAKIEEVASARADRREFRLSHTITCDSIPKPVGTIEIKNNGSTPASERIALSEKGTPLASWAPKALKVSPGSISTAKLSFGNKGCEVEKVSSELIECREIESSTLASTIEFRTPTSLGDGTVAIVEAVVRHKDVSSVVKLPIVVSQSYHDAEEE